MNVRTYPLVRVLTIAVSVVALFSALSAQIAPKGGTKAHSIPISKNIVRFEVIHPSGKSADLVMYEGGMAKFGSYTEGYAFAVVPTIKNMGQKTATFTIFHLLQDDQGNESINQLQKLDIGQISVTTETTPQLQIRVVGIESPKAASTATPELAKVKPNKAQLLQASGDAGRSKSACSGQGIKASQSGNTAAADPDCCLSCGDIWACAICVRMSCGCCCDPPYSCDDFPPIDP